MNTETNNEVYQPPVAPEHYNPNQLVTYKVIDVDSTQKYVSYPTVKVTEIEWDMEQKRYNTKHLAQYINKVGQLENRLADYLDMDSEEIVADICSIFGFNPTKEIQFEATATITGTVLVPLDEVSNFDVSNLDLNVYAELGSYDGEADVEIDNIYKL